MPRRSSKGDVAQNALRVIEQAIGAELKPSAKTLSFPPRKKNPAAVALGKLGGIIEKILFDARIDHIRYATLLTRVQVQQQARLAAQTRNIP